MIGLQITTERPEAVPKQVATEPMVRVGSRAAASATREYLFAQDRARSNKLGGKRTHFFGQAARSVQNPTVHGFQNGTLGRFAINHVGLTQRWLGGTIRPVRARLLAIPARAEAYGKGPREFKNLHFEPGRRGGALVTNLQTGLKRTKTGFKSAGQSGGVVMFWLVKSVSQEPDPKVMIGEEALTAAVTKAMTEHLATRLETGQ